MLLAPGVAARGADAERRRGRISHVVGDRLHVGGAAARLRPRRVRRARPPRRGARASARGGRQRSRPGGDRTCRNGRCVRSRRPASRRSPSRDVHIEPTDVSLREAGAWARAERPDGYVAVGGGSVIDTAKAMNLLATNDGDLAEYLNPPIGAGRAPTQPLDPLIAMPTTAGTGAESTPVCILGHPCAPGEDRHQPPGAPPATGHRRPADDDVAAARRDHRERDGRPVPRPRVVHGSPVRCPTEARRARRHGRPTTARTRSATSGRPGRSACSAAGSAAPSTSRATSRRARG